MLNTSKRFLTSFAAIVAALSVFAAMAMAATITGSDDPESLRGTNKADTITANGGDDKVDARAGADIIDLGVGNDRSYARRGHDLVRGGDGDDKLHGGPGNDTQYGDAGNDLIYAGLGRDVTYGGEGNDVLWALARGDVRGRYDTRGDTLYGEGGDDVFRTRDGERDLISCGEGNDTAYLDYKDRIVDATAANKNGSCETVVRRSRNHRDNSETAH